MNKLSKQLYLSLMLMPLILEILEIPLSYISIGLATFLELLQIFFLIVIPIAWLVFLYKIWSAIQDIYVRTTPGKAIGFLFIPIFNFYWLFQVIWGFAKDYNKYLKRYNFELPRLPENLFLFYCILWLLASLLSVPALILIVPLITLPLQEVPSEILTFSILFLIFGIIEYVIHLFIIAKSCDAVNKLIDIRSSRRSDI